MGVAGSTPVDGIIYPLSGNFFSWFLLVSGVVCVMNVLVCTSSASSASHGLSNALRSVLSPFYTVQSVLPPSLAKLPWTASCALLVVLPPDDIPSLAHEAIQDYISAGGCILGIGLGATLSPRRQLQGRFELWDARSGTAIVPQFPQAAPSLSPSSILLQMGTHLSGLRRASVPFVLTPDASDVQVIRGRWEEPVDAIAGIQVPVGSGRAAFWDILPCSDDTENVTALLRYTLTSLGLSVPPETTAANESSNPPPFSIPRYALPQFLLHPRGKRHISETILQRLGLGHVESSGPSSGGDSEPEPVVVVIKDRADTFHLHKAATLEHGARLVAEAKAFTADTSDMSDAERPRLIVVLPPDVPPTGELTPRFDADKYFAVLAEARGDQTSGAESWGIGEALFYGEVVTSTQTMLERYAFTPLLPRPAPPRLPFLFPILSFPFSFPLSRFRSPNLPQNDTIETPDSWRPSKPRSSHSRHSSSLGAAAVPTRGSPQQDASNSPSSSARHWALRGSPRPASSSYSTSLGWPSSARVATSARWAPSGVHVCG